MTLAALALFTVFFSAPAKAQTPALECWTETGTRDGGHNYGYRLDLAFHRQYGTGDYIALINEEDTIDGEPGRQVLREGLGTLTRVSASEIRVNYTVDINPAPGPFGRHQLLVVRRTGSGRWQGRLMSQGIFQACMVGRRDEEACMRETGQTLQHCRVR